MWKYFVYGNYDGSVFGLVRLHNIDVERYDGKEIWNANWGGSGQAYMDICGMGDGWSRFREIKESEVEETQSRNAPETQKNQKDGSKKKKRQRH